MRLGCESFNDSLDLDETYKVMIAFVSHSRLTAVTTVVPAMPTVYAGAPVPPASRGSKPARLLHGMVTPAAKKPALAQPCTLWGLAFSSKAEAYRHGAKHGFSSKQLASQLVTSGGAPPTAPYSQAAPVPPFMASPPQYLAPPVLAPPPPMALLPPPSMGPRPPPGVGLLRLMLWPSRSLCASNGKRPAHASMVRPAASPTKRPPDAGSVQASENGRSLTSSLTWERGLSLACILGIGRGPQGR